MPSAITGIHQGGTLGDPQHQAHPLGMRVADPAHAIARGRDHRSYKSHTGRLLRTPYHHTRTQMTCNLVCKIRN